MKKGFTILELLVASLLLGMLMTVLTMVFNQSSISWRVGQASIADIDDVSDGVSSMHDVSDNLYVWNGKTYLLTSVWEEGASDTRVLRQNRVLASDGGSSGTAGAPSALADEGRASFTTMFKNVGDDVKNRTRSGEWSSRSVGNAEKGDAANLYTINVKSAGPNKKFDDYDDIWSFPDEFDL